jgi:hypothetical protein
MKPREIPYKQHEELPGSSRFGIEKKGNQEKEKNRERKALTARLLSVLELSEEQIGPLGREYTQEFVEGRFFALGLGLEHAHVESLGVSLLHEEEDEEGESFSEEHGGGLGEGEVPACRGGRNI